MNANELMVSDWVLINKSPDSPYYKQFGIEDFETDKYQYCEPIPLTREILEKNGWTKHTDYCWLISENNGRRLIEYRTDYLDGLLRISYAEEPFSKLMIKVKYVHELQHALRLCGIEKEIEI